LTEKDVTDFVNARVSHFKQLRRICGHTAKDWAILEVTNGRTQWESCCVHKFVS
jgi:hypothetical protein